MLGILLIDKPLGCTSHDVVNDIRRRFHTKRVGHAGTLDPLATGLLVVAVGPATRFLQYLLLEPKEYRAEMTFGATTTTYDGEGEVTSESAVPDDLPAIVEREKPSFCGLIQQIPPMYSAVKMGGKALYKYARAGTEVTREPRTVHIGRLDFEWLGSARARVHIECSGGTYVRSLAHDLGRAAGCGAYLSVLRRTRVGRFAIEDARPLHEASAELMMPLDQALAPMPMVPLSALQTIRIREGRQVGIEEPATGPLAALLDPEGKVFGIARVQGNLLQPECVIPSKSEHEHL